jgi:hypothetical protein
LPTIRAKWYGAVGLVVDPKEPLMRCLVPLLSCVVFFACGPNARDVRVKPPPTDSSYFEVTTPEQIVPAGEERMFCTDMIYKGPDTPFRDVESFQGKFGHHVILMSTAKPKPEGTTYDCTDIKTMKDMRPFGIPLELPPGYANWMPNGTALVVQMHYVNTSKEDILVRDFIRLKKVAESEVLHWAAPIATNQAEFSIPPRSPDTKVEFDCTIDRDFDLLLLGGHMHERGSYFRAQIGPDTAHLETKYETPEWKPDFRDAPPVTLFTSAPVRMKAGTVIRTTCQWNNDTDKELKFPEEMCATFGVIGETRDPWVCGIVTE